MSASLVGSEMCIRDRRYCPRPGPAPRPRSALPRAKQIGRCGGQWRPVSYTHLTLPTICSV
eukprot:2048144-Alexandrium_andersonii.AAC.1